jgi:aerobic-type carbon monoxide dehydrogenase small subunit (CoxS/CutS family)
VRVAFEVNGEQTAIEVEPRTTLADALRHELGLTGTHVGCEHGVCGACTVQVDGEPVRACLMLAVQAEGLAVRTVEGMAGADGDLHPLQRALHERHGLQCGFCTPGILMTLEPFLRDHPGATEAEVRAALAGNLCRCTGYEGIVEAALDVLRAAERADDIAPRPGAGAAAPARAGAPGRSDPACAEHPDPAGLGEAP